MKVYPDHNVVSGIVKEDLPGGELDAMATILEWHGDGRIDLRKSGLHDRELEPYGDLERKPQIKEFLSRFAGVPFVEAQELKGFYQPIRATRGSYVISPVIEGNPTWRSLLDEGLSRVDAHHLTLAILAECNAFLTLDERTILNRREAIEKRFPQIRLMKPTEFVSQVNLDKKGKAIWSAP